jgi:CRP-like cAMP-binding protein
MRTLKRVTLFQDFSRGSLKDLSEFMHYRDYKADEYVYHQDDPGLGLYIVQRGHIQLIVGEDSGEPVTVAEVSANGFFGERSLVLETARAESARVVTDARLLGFFKPDLKTLYKRHPQVGMIVTMTVARFLAMRQDGIIDQLSKQTNPGDAARFAYESESKIELRRSSHRSHDPNPKGRRADR